MREFDTACFDKSQMGEECVPPLVKDIRPAGTLHTWFELVGLNFYWQR